GAATASDGAGSQSGASESTQPDASSDDGSQVPQSVTLSPDQQVLANVKTVKVTPKALSQAIRTVGRVAYDQTRISHITARIDGRLDSVAPLAAGDSIVQGQEVGTLFSPDLIAAAQDLRVAKEATSRIGTSFPEVASDTRSMLKAARERLKLWGLSDRQIAGIEAGKTNIDIPVLAPLGGTVMARKVEVGQYVKAGDVLFDLADLSRVWIAADVHDADLDGLSIGDPVDVTAVAYPRRHWRGKVAQLGPELDPQSRTLAVRIELANPGFALRPQMDVGSVIHRAGHKVLAVPAPAVIDTGTRHVVWVKTDEETFVPRTVTVGMLAGEVYPVLSGLKAGEEVAVSGGFLLDASAQMQGGQ
ncbi:MAG: efflux RND transporter periplasmic adaptor subunit, partial [Cyanobacteria bacterium REEB65]|nr:efflux RND transporter periplasmic adaptor subunit [Cyanobacteria bacterium REEB65]